jgi:DNA-binding response OmpR family regulator
MKKYRLVVLDDDDSLRQYLVDWLRVSAFEAKAYGEAESVLADVFPTDSAVEKMPDLLLLDMNLKPAMMQGIDLLHELIERDVPTEIMAVSMDSGEHEKAIRMGAASSICKPFDNPLALNSKMEFHADIGKHRRLYRISNGQNAMDRSRRVRPVFLSYSNKDKHFANGIRLNLERRKIAVWYAPSTITIGDEWIQRIEDGIDQAKIFIPILTDNYIASPICLGELTRFYGRMERHEKPDLTILPVLAGISEEGKRHGNIRPVLERYHYIDIADRYIDRLTVLLMKIQNVLDAPIVNRLQRKKAA